MGRVINSRGRDLSENEQALAEWVEGRPDDMLLHLETIWDEEEGEEFDVCAIGVEQKLNDGVIVMQFVDVGCDAPRAVWSVTEDLARAGLADRVARLRAPLN